MFTQIDHISQLQEAVGHKKEIRFAPQANGTTVVCYMVADSDTFDSSLAKECRGITFDSESGIPICRPLHKFFNVGEREETQVHAVDWSGIVRGMSKLDGSMITPCFVKGQLAVKSKKSFDSDVARSSLAFLHRPENKNLFDFCSVVCSEYTPIFEYTSPTARIVIGYPVEALTLLHVRNIKTGEYIPLSSGHMLELIEQYKVPVVSEIADFNILNILSELKTSEGIEGYVLQANTGEMYKAKSDWYLRLHHAVTFLRERDVAEMVVLESIDDAKSALVEAGCSLSEVLAVEKRVVHQLIEIENEVDILLQEARKLPDRKTVALTYRENPLFGLLMTAYTGKDPDVKDYFLKHIWKQQYTLNQLTNIEADG